MVQLGMANSRMKDFFDIAVLARNFDFEGAVLVQAIRATFERRKTPLPTTLPVALMSPFTQWSGFVRKAGIHDARTLSETAAAVAAFVAEPLTAATSQALPNRLWQAGGP
jgi:hypothetical protein